MIGATPLPGVGGAGADLGPLLARLADLEARQRKLLSVVPVLATQVIDDIASLAPTGATHVEFETIGGGCSGMRLSGINGSEGGMPGFIHRSPAFLLDDLAGRPLTIVVGAGGLSPTSSTSNPATAPMNPGGETFVSVGAAVGRRSHIRNFLSAAGGGAPLRAISSTTWTSTIQSRLHGLPIHADYVPSHPPRQMAGSFEWPVFSARGPGAGGCAASPGATVILMSDASLEGNRYVLGGKAASDTSLNGEDADPYMLGACGAGGCGVGGFGTQEAGNGGFPGGGGGASTDSKVAGNGANGLVRIAFYGPQGAVA